MILKPLLWLAGILVILVLAVVVARQPGPQ